MSDLATEYGMAKSVFSTILKHKEAIKRLRKGGGKLEGGKTGELKTSIVESTKI